MQPAHRLRAQPAQLVAAITQQPQADQRVITAHHRNARAAQRSWRLRPGLRDCERLSILLHHGWMREPKHHRTDQTDGATVPRSRSGAGKRRWLDPSGAHISDLDRGPWISCAIGTWPNHLRSNAPAMPDTYTSAHSDFVADLAQRGRGDETYVTVKLHIGSRHRCVHRHGRPDSGIRVRLRGEHDTARRNLAFSGGRLVE